MTTDRPKAAGAVTGARLEAVCDEAWRCGGTCCPSTGTFFFRYANGTGPVDETLEFGILDGYPVAGTFGLERSNQHGPLLLPPPSCSSIPPRVALTRGTGRPI